jgi:hypothetical protein
MASNGATEEIDLYGKSTKFYPTTHLMNIEILGLPKSASKSEIKKAYHKVGFFVGLISSC